MIMIIIMIMKLIYMQYIRVILEGSCQVWCGALTVRNKRDLERVQKLSLKIIIPSMSYKQALTHLILQTLNTRRKIITTRFAKIARIHPKLKHLFTHNNNIHKMQLRKKDTYMNHANTSRYMNSPILYMPKLLNELK